MRLTALLALSALCFAAPDRGLGATPGSILWDQYAVPHIYGPDIPTVVRGLGYAQMENHAETLLNNAARARGRSAEYFGPGPGNFNLDYDIRVRTYGIPQRAQQWVAQGGDFQASVLQAFCDGVNEYAQAHPDDILPALKPILPVVPADITAGELNTIWFTFLPETSNVPGFISAWQAGGIDAANAAARSVPKTGSNGWAVAPAKSVTGNAILMGNPHLPWGVNQPVDDSQGGQNFGVYQWIEANLVVGPSDAPTLNASGVTFIGGPFIGIGFNDYLGWTHTNNTIKNADLYQLTLAGKRYLYRGRYVPLAHSVDTVKVLQTDGSLTSQQIDIYASVQGPVVAFNADNTRALALRVPGLDQPSLVTQYWNMIQAQTLDQFEAAEAMLQMPFFNTIYADRDGSIFYLFGGQQPRRHGGTFDDYAKILDGSGPSTLWLETLPFDQLPQAANPPGGFVANSNNPPWTSAYPQTPGLDPTQFPAWIAPSFVDFRAQHGADFLMSQAKFTAADILGGKMSTEMYLADRVLPDLLAAARSSGNANAEAAATILAAWDHTADADSVGGVLFEEWWNEVSADIGAGKITPDTSMGPYVSPHPAFQTPWSAAAPFTTPSGLDPVNDAQLVADLGNAYTVVQTNFSAQGGASVPWGGAHKTTLDDRSGATQDFTFPFAANNPQSGADDQFGPMRVTNPIYISALGEFISYGGDGYVQIIEFTPSGAVGGTLLTYGNASRPNSAHVTDQLPFFDSKTLKPALRTLSQVQANAVKTESY